MVIEGDLVTQYTQFVQGGLEAFIPLLTAVIGVFLAFAIAEKLRFFIGRMAKK